MVKVLINEGEILDLKYMKLVNSNFDDWELYNVPSSLSEEERKEIVKELENFDKVFLSNNNILLIDMTINEYTKTDKVWTEHKIYIPYKDRFSNGIILGAYKLYI